MSIVDTMGVAAEAARAEIDRDLGLFDYTTYKWPEPHRVRYYPLRDADNIFRSDSAEAAKAFYEKHKSDFIFRAALRSVKPSDISDEMVRAACNAIYPARWADKREAEMRRAIAAAIAKGGE